jgi:hypothetical protein
MKTQTNRTALMKRILVAITIILSSPSSFGQVYDGLFAEFLFDDATANATVGDIDGIISNAYSDYDRFGCPNRAFKFIPGDDSYIDLGNNFNDVFAKADTSWSVSFWCQLTTPTATNSFVLAKYGFDGPNGCGEHQRQFIIRKSPAGHMSLTYYSVLTGPTDYVIASGNTVINDALWHHVVVNYDGSIDAEDGLGRVEIYVDNEAEDMYIEGIAGTLGNIQTGTAHLGIGNPLNSSGEFCNPTQNYYWPGYLDDFKFYNRTLSAEEVDLLYNVTYTCCNINDTIFINNTITDSSYIGVYHPGDSYQWIDCKTMAIIPGETDNSFYPSEEGTYACIITDGDCIDTTDCIGFDFTSISELSNADFVIFPNPSNGKLMINNLRLKENVNILVIDNAGRVIYQERTIPNSHEIDLSGVSEGIYYIQFQTDNEVFTRKISIVR